MNSANSKDRIVGPNNWADAVDVSQVSRPALTLPKAVISVVLLSLAVLLAVTLVDWVQLGRALDSLVGQPWLICLLLGTYTGAFILRAMAW